MQTYKAKDFKYPKMLDITSQKAAKSTKFGYLTGILYLAPYTKAATVDRDINLCPNACNANCVDLCLDESGRGRFDSVTDARIKKTHYFYDEPEKAMANLVHSIEGLIRKANKMGLIPNVRLNGTSDMSPVNGGTLWERVPAVRNGKLFENIFKAFPDLAFHDYTKLPRQLDITNYHLTASYSPVESYEATNRQAEKLGMNQAVVFFDKLPETFNGKQVIDGDESDLRFLDPANSIVGLVVKKTPNFNDKDKSFIER